ncbi:MAG: LytTR family DNA-binding domain-containing protein [Saprospiraceae bacterium]|nr:LytTR family DNA-binding domain-containing protein [Saprospiraceae bacterium]MDW8482977.1 LytTR family DNA-binding domain-containing protein [Saprospiraceae bacterium]
MTRALLIEDEPEGLANLTNLLHKHCPEVEIVATGGSNADLLRLTEGERCRDYDVAFLDINLPDGLVFRGLEKMPEIPFDIVFVTAYDQYALTAFDFAAIDYVLKPIEADDLRRAVNRSRSNRSNTYTKARVELLQQNYATRPPQSLDKIGIAGLDGVHFVRLNEIVRLEAEDNYTHFLLSSGQRITASKTIKAYEDILRPLNFVRVHKKHIVNMRFMKTYIKGEGGYLKLENGETIEVSRRKKAPLLDAMRQIYGEI